MAKAQSNTLPQGSSVKATLADGEHTITITRITVDGDCQMNECEYPGGFRKDHQGLEVADIAPKITNQLKGYFGVSTAIIKTLPKQLEVGATITAEVSNGA